MKTMNTKWQGAWNVQFGRGRAGNAVKWRVQAGAENGFEFLEVV